MCVCVGLGLGEGLGLSIESLGFGFSGLRFGGCAAFPKLRGPFLKPLGISNK